MMSEEDLERGMELARMAGEMEAVGLLADRLDMPVLSAFLLTRSEDLQDIAVDTIIRFGSNRALSQMIAAKGVEIGEMGAEEVAEGLTRVAVSKAMADRSEELAAAGVVLGVQGVAEVETALEDVELAREVGYVGVTEIAEGAARLGAAESAG